MTRILLSNTTLEVRINGAESTPFEYSVAGGSVSSRADGYGMPGVTVDGQSVLDIYEVGKEAVSRARSGAGPT